jgi:hypothetical protein
LAADGAPGSNSPLVLGLLDPESGIFAPGVSLQQGIINACESVGKLSGVDMRQRPIKVNIDCLGNVILQARPLAQAAVSEGSGSADTATSQYQIEPYLKRRGLARIAERLSEELGLEEIDDLKHVEFEEIGQLEWIKPVQKKKLLELLREDFQEDIAAKIGSKVGMIQSKGGYDDMEDITFDDKGRAVGGGGGGGGVGGGERDCPDIIKKARSGSLCKQDVKCACSQVSLVKCFVYSLSHYRSIDR